MNVCTTKTGREPHVQTDPEEATGPVDAAEGCEQEDPEEATRATDEVPGGLVVSQYAYGAGMPNA